MATENFSVLETKVISECTLAVMPKTAGEYRDDLADVFDSHMRMLRKRMSPSAGTGIDQRSIGVNGFSLDQSFFYEFNCLVDEIRNLILNADVLFDAKRQKEIVANCQGAQAKFDDKFQRVLTRLKR